MRRRGRHALPECLLEAIADDRSAANTLISLFFCAADCQMLPQTRLLRNLRHAHASDAMLEKLRKSAYGLLAETVACDGFTDSSDFNAGIIACC